MTRAIHPWIGMRAAGELRGPVRPLRGATICGTATTRAGWARSAACWPNDEEHAPEVGRYNAGQKLVFWPMTLLILALFVSGTRDLGVYFFDYTTIEQKRSRS